MKRKVSVKSRLFFILILFLASSPLLAETNPVGSVGVPRLLFDATGYDFGTVKQEEKVEHLFVFKNAGTADLILQSLKTSCGCTAASASTGPFKAGESSAITATYDTRGKFGRTEKEIKVFSNDPTSPHTLRISGTVMAGAHPMKGTGDVIFVGSCADCHSIPAKGKAGKELYDAVCFMCHDAPQQHGRSALAPDRFSLADLSASDLKRVVAKGIPGSSMSAFSDSKKGPLSKKQISSLVEYILSLKKGE